MAQEGKKILPHFLIEIQTNLSHSIRKLSIIARLLILEPSGQFIWCKREEKRGRKNALAKSQVFFICQHISVHLSLGTKSHVFNTR